MSKVYGVVGSAAIDIYAVSKSFKPETTDRQSHITLSYGKRLWLDNAIQEPGGSGLLSAILFSRQGAQTYLVTKTGADVFSQIITKVAEDESIVLSDTRETTKHHTDTVIHLTSEGNDQTVLCYTGSYLSLNKYDCEAVPTSVDWLHIATLPAEKSILLHIIKIAKNSHANISINPQLVHNLPSRVLLKVLIQCNIVVISRDEASILVGTYCSIAEAAQKLYNIGLEHVVVYDDQEGVVVVSNGTVYETGSIQVGKTIDPSGAEEVFAASYVYMYSNSQDIGIALTFGLAQASSVRLVAGARAGILQKPVLEPIKVNQYALKEEKL